MSNPPYPVVVGFPRDPNATGITFDGATIHIEVGDTIDAEALHQRIHAIVRAAHKAAEECKARRAHSEVWGSNFVPTSEIRLDIFGRDYERKWICPCGCGAYAWRKEGNGGC